MPWNRKNFDSPRRSAIALIDLVGVVAVVSIFLLVAYPSLESARGVSKESVCLDRLRDISSSTAALTASDSAGQALPIHPAQFMQTSETLANIGTYEWGGKSGVGRNTFVDAYAGSPLGSKFGTAAGFGPARRPLNDFLYPEGFDDHGSIVFPDAGQFDEAGALADTKLPLNKFRCPADNGPPRAAHCPDWISNPTQSSFDHFGTSYAANTFMIKAGQDTTPLMSNSPYLRPLGNVPNPARTIAYEENIGRWAWAARSETPQCDWIGRGVDPGFAGSIRGWHGKDWTFQRSFLDGHAEKQKIYVEGSEDRDNYALHYQAEQLPQYPPLPECGNCAPLDLNCTGTPGNFEQYRCIIVRGPGWQKDTLPAPFVCTGLLSGPGSPRASFEDCVQSE